MTIQVITLLTNINITSVYSVNTSHRFLPLQLVGQLLVTLDLPNSLGSVVSPRVVLTFVVNEHSDELIIHDLHVDLEFQSVGNINSRRDILPTWPSSNGPDRSCLCLSRMPVLSWKL